MLTTSAATIAEVTHGVILAGPSDVSGTSVAVDSRDVSPGAVFVALPGEHVDGHEFLGRALESGARVLVVTRSPESLGVLLENARGAGVAVVRVADALLAVQELATWHRSRLRCPVVGITGSTGKTTTKDFLNAALATKFDVISTAGNRNNELGVPLTVLEAGATCEVLVIEMGMRGTGQIARLCEIARPTVGLVTNVGVTHVEVVGSEDAIVAAKGELVAAIPASGVVYLNGDDARSQRLVPLAVAPVVRYGLEGSSDVRADNIELDAESRASFDIATRSGEVVRVSLPIPGRHNVYNALAAAAVASGLGVDPSSLAEGLAATSVSGMRMEVFQTASGVTVINDAYNANPTSMRAAIETLASMEVSGKRVAVLGDMAELGSLTELAHFGIGEFVAASAIDALVTVGPRAENIALGARAEGLSSSAIWPCKTVDEALDVLDRILVSGDAVLVKASRVMGLEAAVEGIVTPRA